MNSWILSGGRRSFFVLTSLLALACTSCNSGGGGGGGATGKPTQPPPSGSQTPLALTVEAISPLRDVTAVTGELVKFRIELGTEHDPKTTRVSWSLDGKSLGVDTLDLELQTGAILPGAHRVSALISENDASASLSWNLKTTAREGENRAPFLLQALPGNRVSAAKGSRLSFSVVAADVDANDSLEYIWNVDQDSASTSADGRTFELDTSGLEPGEHSVSVYVTDGFEHPGGPHFGSPPASYVWRIAVLEPDEPEPPRICGAWPMGSLRLARSGIARFDVEACGSTVGAGESPPLYLWDINGSPQGATGPSFEFDSSSEEGTLEPGAYRVTCKLADESGKAREGDAGVGWTVYLEPDSAPRALQESDAENVAPTAELVLPAGPMSAEVGMAQCFQLSTNDPERDVLSYLWLVNGKVQLTDGPVLCWMPTRSEAESTASVEVYVSDGHTRGERIDLIAGNRLASWNVDVASSEAMFLSAISGAVVLDNGASGTSSTGAWIDSSGSGPYGSGSLFSKAAGATYTYDVKLPLAGTYDVSLWWTSLPGRSSAVAVKVTGRSGVANFKVDQRTQGGQWNKLGTLDFSATAKIVITSAGGDASTCADAVRLSPVSAGGSTPGTAPIQPSGTSFVIDDGTPGTSYIGAWSASLGASPYGLGSLYAKSAGNTYTFARPLASGGTYDVYAWWTQWPSRDTAAIYRITHSSGSADVKVNQQVGGGQWNRLGRYTFGKTVEVKVVVPGAASVCADAVRFVPVTSTPEPTPAGEVIVDNGGKGTSAVGAWGASTAPNPYGVSSLYAKGTGYYAYDVSLPAQGRYGVFAWYTQWSSRESAVPYEISHSGGTATVTVDQRSGGGQWRLLGDYTFGSTTKIVVRVVDADTVCADAVRFLARSGSPAPASSDKLALSWTAPTRNVDGSELEDLGGFKVYYKAKSGSFTRLADVGFDTEYVVTTLGSGTYTFAVSAYDWAGNESAFSATVAATVP